MSESSREVWNDRASAGTPEERHRATRLLRRYHEGVIGVAERRGEVRYVVDGASGQVVMAVEAPLARASELLLLSPDESTVHLQLALTPTIIARPESEECVDRWSAYHGASGAAPGRAWVRCRVDGLKSSSEVFGPEDLRGENPLRSIEGKLVKRLNADRAGVARACKLHGAVGVADPLVVGVDGLGVDVRARFGIVRLEYPDGLEARTPEQAERALAWLMGPSETARVQER